MLVKFELKVHLGPLWAGDVKSFKEQRRWGILNLITWKNSMNVQMEEHENMNS